MENFEVSEIKRFLRWANYSMTDALQVIGERRGAGHQVACARD